MVEWPSMDEGCGNMEKIRPPVEFMVEARRATPEGIVDWGGEGVFKLEQSVGELEESVGDDEFIGIHNTLQTNAEAIMRKGFRENSYNTISPNKLRTKVVFCWHYYSDAEGHISPEADEDAVSVLLTSNIRDVMCAGMDKSSLLVRDAISSETYAEDYVMWFSDYLRCIRQGEHKNEAMSEEAMIQDHSGYETNNGV